MIWTRREMLVSAGAFALAAQQEKRGWYDRPMRWAQVAFTEDDPGKFDLGMWLKYFKEIHADAACLSAGGCVAFYPTQIPFHYKSKFLGNTDPFGDFVKGCRGLGMNVIARTDPHACTEEAFRAHPEWVARLADGSPRRHWADPKLYVTCALGPYNFDFMTEVTREIVKMYQVDGVFSNRWHGHGTCYCASCQKEFRAFCGLELPKTPDHRDAARTKWIEWNQKRLFQLWDVWDGVIRKENPAASFIPNSGGGALSELDMKTVGAKTQTLFADKQARRGLTVPWANGKNGKEYRATMGNKPIGGIFSVGLEEPYRWKDSVQGPLEIEMWVRDGIAQGLRPWFTKFNAKPIDKRWMSVVSNVYQWHWKHEKYLRNEANLARVAIVYSQQTAHYYGGEKAKEKVEDAQLGFYELLVEERIPFEMVHDGMLDGANVDRFQLLILPNIAALSRSQCAQIGAYVARGGSVIATGETSLYDEWGEMRTDFGLGALFGCRYQGGLEERMQNSYLRLEHEVSGNPLVKGLEDVTRIINGVRRVKAEAVAGAGKPWLTLIPSYPDLPMESVYTSVERTSIPAVFARQHGKGKAVYFPMDLDRTYWDVLSPDHAVVLRNAIEWAAPGARVVQVIGRGVLDVAYWRQKESLSVHLVNLTNPRMMKGPVTEIYPVGPLEVSVEVPTGVAVKQVKLLTAGTAAKWRTEGNRVVVEVPTVAMHEVIVYE